MKALPQTFLKIFHLLNDIFAIEKTFDMLTHEKKDKTDGNCKSKNLAQFSHLLGLVY